jgi:RNA polymerase sigma-70 factor (ECF subfamily)
VLGQDLEDTVQEVFLHLMRSLNGYDESYPLTKFVCVIAERVSTDEHRFRSRDKRQGETISLDLEDCDNGIKIILSSAEDLQDEKVARAQELQRLRASFRALSEKCREILKMRYEQELPFKHIGELLGATENTVTVQARRCLDELRALFQRADERGAIS